jgi:excisionase family DNA binding protein
MSDRSEYLSPEEAAAYLSVTSKFLAHLRSYGGSPLYSKIGSRSIRYRRSDLDAWMAEKARTSTFAGAPA